MGENGRKRCTQFISSCTESLGQHVAIMSVSFTSTLGASGTPVRPQFSHLPQTCENQRHRPRWKRHITRVRGSGLGIPAERVLLGVSGCGRTVNTESHIDRDRPFTCSPNEGWQLWRLRRNGAYLHDFLRTSSMIFAQKCSDGFVLDCVMTENTSRCPVRCFPKATPCG